MCENIPRVHESQPIVFMLPSTSLKIRTIIHCKQPQHEPNHSRGAWFNFSSGHLQKHWSTPVDQVFSDELPPAASHLIIGVNISQTMCG